MQPVPLREAIPQRHFDDLVGLHQHLFFSELKKDISEGRVFPAVGKNEMRFYCGGARLCVYRDKNMFTNNRFLNKDMFTNDHILVKKTPTRDVAMRKSELSLDLYRKVKSEAIACRNIKNPGSDKEKELRIVSGLFSHFSIGRTGLSANQPRLLDIECRFLNSIQKNSNAPERNNKSDMIDCLFLLPRGTLVFLEIKHTDNPAARGASTSTPKVVDQIKSYNSHLNTECKRNELIALYSRVAETIGKLLDQPALKPLSVYDKVPLLIVGDRREPRKNSKERWQQDLLNRGNEDILGIDGRGDPISALNSFFKTLEP